MKNGGRRGAEIEGKRGGRGGSDNLTKLKAAAASERQEKEPGEEEIGPGSGWC